MHTGGEGPVCEYTVECTLEVQLSGIACLTEKLLQCTLNRRLLQVAGAFYKRFTLSYDKKSLRNAGVEKGFGKCFLISNNIKNKFLPNSLK